MKKLIEGVKVTFKSFTTLGVGFIFFEVAFFKTHHFIKFVIVKIFFNNEYFILYYFYNFLFSVVAAAD